MSELTYEPMFPPLLPILPLGTIQDLFPVDADALPHLNEHQFGAVGAAWCRAGTPGAYQQWPPPGTFHDNIGLVRKLGPDALEMVGWNNGRPLYRYVGKKRRSRKGWPRIYNNRSRRSHNQPLMTTTLMPQTQTLFFKTDPDASSMAWNEMLPELNWNNPDDYGMGTYDGNFSLLPPEPHGASDVSSVMGSPNTDNYSSTTNTLYYDTTDFGDDLTLEVSPHSREELRRMRVAASDRRCRQCRHLSANYADFLAHAAIHTPADRPERCCVPSCPMLEIGFTRVLDLRWHYYDCHFEKGQVDQRSAPQAAEIESKMYCCPELNCSRFFYRRDSLIRHIRKVHQLDNDETLKLMMKSYPYDRHGKRCGKSHTCTH